MSKHPIELNGAAVTRRRLRRILGVVGVLAVAATGQPALAGGPVDGMHGDPAGAAGWVGDDAKAMPSFGAVIVTNTPNPSAPGEQVKFTATILGKSPTGTVKFADGKTTIAGCEAAPVTLDGSKGKASCSTAALAAGVHVVTATYSGDANNETATGITVQVVLDQGSGPGGFKLSSSRNPVPYGETVTVKATTPGTGTVSFSLDGTAVASCQSLSVAECKFEDLSADAHKIIANFKPASGATLEAKLTQVVLPRKPDWSLEVGTATGDQVPVSVTFVATPNGKFPTGKVMFRNSNNTCTGDIANGKAGCTLKMSQSGSTVIVASYRGDRNFLPDVVVKRAAEAGGMPEPGWWWNPEESGRGFIIENYGKRLFVAMFLYDDTGKSTWYLASGTVETQDKQMRFAAPLYKFDGGQTMNGSYRHPRGESIGELVIVFTDTRHATATWPGGSSTIQRFAFAPGAGETPDAGAPESGFFWNPEESGRGFALEVQDNTAMVAGFLYDEAGNPRWWLASGQIDASGKFQGKWTEFANGQTLNSPYRAPQNLGDAMGPVEIEFADPRNATLTLPNGRKVSLTKFNF